MATPKPGEIRCPTCHRSTPPAAFCTQCGSAIPSDARIRPRGMDRDELQERIRARRSGGEPYRRGGGADDPSGAYERFQPEPTDAQAARRSADPGAGRRADHFDEAAAAAAAREARLRDAERAEVTRDRDEWGTPAAGTAAAGASWAASRDEEAAYEPEPARVDNYADPAYDDEGGDYPYEYDEWQQEPERRASGAGAFAILGFLALGVLALLGGAVLAGVFSGNGGVAQESPSPSLSASLAPQVSTAPSTAPSAPASADAGGSGEPLASGEPVVFDDGAMFEVQACATNEMSFEGCAQEAEFFSGGSFVAWVGFSGASGSDTLLLVLRQDGAAVADSEFVLGNSPFGCTADCTGYARQGFTGLPPGEYTVELLRNGEPAHGIRIGVD
ncbi:MAG TPA: hypothetical protein VF365_04985 [Candidatus Limnocylindria bacterium]